MNKEKIFEFREEPKIKIEIYNKKEAYMGYISSKREGMFHFFTEGNCYFDERGLLEIIEKLKELNKPSKESHKLQKA